MSPLQHCYRNYRDRDGLQARTSDRLLRRGAPGGIHAHDRCGIVTGHIGRGGEALDTVVAFAAAAVIINATATKKPVQHDLLNIEFPNVY
jgi:hypothetical protein